VEHSHGLCSCALGHERTPALPLSRFTSADVTEVQGLAVPGTLCGKRLLGRDCHKSGGGEAVTVTSVTPFAAGHHRKRWPAYSIHPSR